MNRRGIIWGSLYGARAFFFIAFLGEKLSPDSYLYGRGRAAWSSPALALSGYLGGYPGVCMAGILGAAWLGYVVGRNSPYVFGPAILALSPPGWYTIQPSADACGAASVVALRDRKGTILIVGMVAFFHLEAALCVAAARIVGSRIPIRMDALVFGMGAVACLGQWHMQVRYFLPGLALLALSARKAFLGRSSNPSIHRSTICSPHSGYPSRKSDWERWHSSQYS